MSKKILMPLASIGVMSLVITTVLLANPVKAVVGQVTRISGADRYETNMAVATELVKLEVDPSNVMMD